MDAGLHFLDETCGALDGLSTAECCKRAEMSRVLAFDGVNAAVAVIEEGIRTFTQEIPSGLFNLGCVKVTSFFCSDSTIHERRVREKKQIEFMDVL